MSDIVERRMDAYYYAFDATGVDAIDKILSAVACAGKAYHHTDCWNDEAGPYGDHKGNTPVEWMQNAGNEAAAEITAARARIAELEGALRYCRPRLKHDSYRARVDAQVTIPPATPVDEPRVIQSREE